MASTLMFSAIKKMKITTLKSIKKGYKFWEQNGLRIDSYNSPHELGYRQYFKENRGNFYAIYNEKSKLIALAVFFFDKRKGAIYRLAVDKQFRNKGLAKLLISHIETDAKSRMINSIYCLIENDNLSSLNLFKSMDYNEYPQIKYLTKTL